MAVKLNAYLSFRDTAREAMEFYKSVFGGEVYSDTYEKFQVSEDPAENNKIMHAYLKAPSIELMAADTPNRMEHVAGDTYSLSLSGGDEDEAELRGYWDKLSEGGTISQPLEKAPWGASFGMLTDKFGIRWMVNIGGEQQG